MAIDVTAATSATTCAGCGHELGRKRGRGLAAYCDDCRATRTAALAQARTRSARGVGVYEGRVLGLMGYARELDAAVVAEALAALNTEQRRREYRAAIRALAEAEGL